LATDMLKKSLTNDYLFTQKAKEIYNVPLNAAIERSEELLLLHFQTWGGVANLYSSPGRVEIAGNHTDHNNGLVIAAAVSVDTLAAVSPAAGKIVIKSKGYPDVEVDISDLTAHSEECGTSNALVRGVLQGFAERGYNIGGFNAVTVSSVFKGAGMSSSAAFEVLVARILNDYYNDGKISEVELAVISQFAENEYFGKPSGLMDQAAIATGGVSFIDFGKPKHPIISKLHWVFEDVSLVVINCGGDHSDLTPDYAAIRSDMESVAAFFGKNKLREVAKSDFYTSLSQAKKVLSGRAILRAMHYFEENARVKKIANAIEKEDKFEVFSAINASGLSSATKLYNLYPEGSAAREIPLALALASRREEVAACRVHGGGFAGTILTFVYNNGKEQFIDYMSALYGKENVFSLKIREWGAVKIL